MGARLSTLISALGRHGPPSPRYWPLTGAMLGFAAARAPMAWWESAIERSRKRTAPPMQAPVFIVGHWRSGTTHLHNLMGRAPQFGHISPLASGMPDQLLTLATWFRPWLEKALPEDRHVDRVAVTPDSPQEDEIPLASQQLLSVYHAIYFPSSFRETFDRGVFFDGVSDAEIARWERDMRRFLEKVALHQGKDRLLVKNPVYTGRIERLQAMWPEARFVMIRRNPYVVFASTLHYYRKLMAELALQPFDHVDLEAFVLETYVRLMRAYDAQARTLSGNRLCEVAFEDLEGDPLHALAHVFERLGIEGWTQTRHHVTSYLETLKGYRKNPLRLDPASCEKVEAHWGEWVSRWDYRRPDAQAT